MIITIVIIIQRSVLHLYQPTNVKHDLHALFVNTVKQPLKRYLKCAGLQKNTWLHVAHN